jgi:hypothetical protein
MVMILVYEGRLHLNQSWEVGGVNIERLGHDWNM